jgi:hypothetical protein
VPFAQRKLTHFGVAVWVGRVRGDLHDVIWLVVLSAAFVVLWGASEQWDLAGLWRRVGHALHIDHRGNGVDERP